MNKIIRYIKNYLLYGSLFVVILFGWITWEALISSHVLIENYNIVVRILNRLLGYNFMLWIVTLVLYMVFLVVIPSVRDKTLRRLANLQERDEREEYITGKAARASYIATISLALFFLFFSLFGFTFCRTHIDTGKPGYGFSVRINYHFFSESANKKPETKKPSDEQVSIIFDSSQFSLSSATLILILLGWQLLMFNLTARRERLKGV